MWKGEPYDKVASPQHRWGLDVLDRISGMPITRVLDAGCGSGRVTEALLERFPDAEVVAVDSSDSMLAAAAKRLSVYGERCTLREVDLEDGNAVRNLGMFDAAVSAGALHWVRDHEALFRDLHQILKSGGIFACQSGGRGSVRAVRDVLLDLGVDWRPYNCYASPEESERRLVAAGYEGISCWSTNEIVRFDDTSDLISYVLDGVIAPYVSEFSSEDRLRLAKKVVAQLPDPQLEFVRLNIQARTQP
ncbi:methyltransferase domain-containing protein [Frankia sp. Cpl3]|nr:methyltransferase domain-containing protein [Frankia sp. Cpl3]